MQRCIEIQRRYGLKEEGSLDLHTNLSSVPSFTLIRQLHWESKRLFRRLNFGFSTIFIQFTVKALPQGTQSKSFNQLIDYIIASCHLKTTCKDRNNISPAPTSLIANMDFDLSASLIHFGRVLMEPFCTIDTMRQHRRAKKAARRVPKIPVPGRNPAYYTGSSPASQLLKIEALDFLPNPPVV